MSNTYEVGTRAWQPDQTEGWVASEVRKKTVDGDKIKLVFALDNGEVSGGDVHVVLMLMAETLISRTDTRGRDDTGGVPGGCDALHAAPFNEPSHARSQRRSYQLVPSQRARRTAGD
jgi:hypothetical protein